MGNATHPIATIIICQSVLISKKQPVFSFLVILSISFVNEIQIPIQGGLDPKVLLTDKENLNREAIKYLQIFKDHPYVFNLGHGILPETKIEMVEELVKIVRDFK